MESLTGVWLLSQINPAFLGLRTTYVLFTVLCYKELQAARKHFASGFNDDEI